MASETLHYDPLLGDQTTLELLEKAQAGDHLAVEALIQRSLPSLKRWAHGRLPSYARGALDTGDLVQDAAFHAIQKAGSFVPEYVGSMQAYLRRSVMNQIRDEVRRVITRPATVELPANLRSNEESPLESTIRNQEYSRYRVALRQLKPRDRAIAIARLEGDWTLSEIATSFGLRSDAARMALKRTLDRLFDVLTSLESSTRVTQAPPGRTADPASPLRHQPD